MAEQDLVGRPETIVDVLSARASSQALAYVFLADGTPESEQRWTFADVAEQSDAVAAALRGRRIGIGDRVLLARNPGLQYVAALYAIMKVGAIPVPCFPPLRPKELDRFGAIARDCLPTAIVIDPMYTDRMQELQTRFADDGFNPVIIDSVDDVGGDARTHQARRRAADLALIQYTSGSTGSPKGVCLTHDNLMSNCEALARNMGEDPERLGLSWLPPYHDMGLLGTIILSMYHGWPLVLMSPMHFVQQPRRWLEAITHYRVSITVGPNFSLDLCADALLDGDTADLDLSTVRQLYCGAEPISVDTLERFERRLAPLGFDGDALIPCYGLAEATLFLAGKRRGSRYRTYNTPETPDRTVVSCGAVDAEHTVRIVDPSTRRPVGDGSVGEVWVSGRSVAAGYYSRPERSHNVFAARLPGDQTDYLRTGDLGFMRSDELFVTGRIKDLIVVNGRNIYPQDVEATVLRADPGVRRAVAFAVLGEDTEQLCVVAEPAHQMNSYSGMVEAIRTSLTAEFGVGALVHICAKRAIPTTTSGKVRRQEARRMFLADELSSGCTA
jgi:acyl-CoA synthetase (AMP-forming)/AMP-acid ligase II